MKSRVDWEVILENTVVDPLFNSNEDWRMQITVVVDSLLLSSLIISSFSS
jgi:hypothetical protein